mgnify:CR=1 FL=1
MELYKTNPTKLMIMAAVIDGKTKFLKFSGKMDAYASDLSYAAKYGNEPDYSFIDAEFDFVEQDKATLFSDLTELVKVVEFDYNKDNKLSKLLADNNISFEDVIMQNISGTHVTISVINLKVLFSHLGM